MAPQWGDIGRLIAEPILQPIYDLATPRMAFGRIAILGDAAFVARPHVAAGVSKAADDPVALAQALTAPDDGASALRRFEAERRAGHRRIIRGARPLGRLRQPAPDEEERARS